MRFFLVSCSYQDPEEGRASGKVLLLYNPNMTLPIDDIYVFTVLNKLFYIKGNSSHTHRPIHVNFTLIEMNSSRMTFFLPLKNIHFGKKIVLYCFALTNKQVLNASLRNNLLFFMPFFDTPPALLLICHLTLISMDKKAHTLAQHRSFSTRCSFCAK